MKRYPRATHWGVQEGIGHTAKGAGTGSRASGPASAGFSLPMPRRTSPVRQGCDGRLPMRWEGRARSRPVVGDETCETQRDESRMTCRCGAMGPSPGMVGMRRRPRRGVSGCRTCCCLQASGGWQRIVAVRGRGSAGRPGLEVAVVGMARIWLDLPACGVERVHRYGGAVGLSHGPGWSTPVRSRIIRPTRVDDIGQVAGDLLGALDRASLSCDEPGAVGPGSSQ